MNKLDLQKLIGAERHKTEYLPVGCLLSSGHGIAGFYNGSVNEALSDTCVLLNARLVELDRDPTSRRGVSDFNDFIEDIVGRYYSKSGSETLPETELSASSIPLTALPYSEIVLLYPVARIAELLERTEHQAKTAGTESKPSFLDFDNKSIVMKALRTKLW